VGCRECRAPEFRVKAMEGAEDLDVQALVALRVPWKQKTVTPGVPRTGRDTHTHQGSRVDGNQPCARH